MSTLALKEEGRETPSQEQGGISLVTQGDSLSGQGQTPLQVRGG